MLRDEGTACVAIAHIEQGRVVPLHFDLTSDADTFGVQHNINPSNKYSNMLALYTNSY